MSSFSPADDGFSRRPRIHELREEHFALSSEDGRGGEPLIARLSAEFFYHAERKEWEAVTTLMEEIGISRLSEAQQRELLNARHSVTSFTLLHIMAHEGAPLRVFSRALDLGSDPSLTVEYPLGPRGELIERCTAAHIAAVRKNYDLCAELAQAGESHLIRNKLGEDALCVLGKYRASSLTESEVRQAAEAVEVLIDRGCPFDFRLRDRRAALHHLVQWGAAPVLESAFAAASRRVTREPGHDLSGEEIVSFALHAIVVGVEAPQVARFLRVVASGCSPKDANKPQPGWEGVLLRLAQRYKENPQAERGETRRLLSSALDVLEIALRHQLVSKEKIHTVVNAVDPLKGESTLSALARAGIRVRTMKRLVELGADISPSAAGGFPLEAWISEKRFDSLKPLDVLLSPLGLRRMKPLESRSVFLSAMKTGNAVLILKLIESGIPVPDEYRELRCVLPSSSGAAVGTMDLHESLKFIVEARGLMKHKYQREELDQFIAFRSSIADGVDYLRAAISLACPSANDPAPFMELIPRIFSRPEGSVDALVSRVEDFMDYNSDQRGFHPNSAELMLLLKHPAGSKFGEALNPTVRAITSITRFIDESNRPRADLSWRAVMAWGDIATIGWSFLPLRFFALNLNRLGERDSAVIETPALLTKFGFEYHSPDRDHPSYTQFGSGFRLRPGSKPCWKIGTDSRGEVFTQSLDPATFIDLRHGFIFVSNPRWGSLLIRNDSVKFGRSVLPDQAYWSPKAVGSGISVERIHNLTAKTLKRLFRENSVISWELYRTDSFIDANLEGLVGEYRTVMATFNRWIFDTNPYTMWDEGETGEQGRPKLVGGTRSEGFPAFVSLLTKLQARTESSPAFELAFFHPEYAPIAPYPYMLNGERHRTLPVTKEVLAVLQGSVVGHVDRNEARRLGVIDFMQSGIKNQGALTILPVRDSEASNR